MASIEKIDIYNSVRAFEASIKKLEQELSISPENRELLVQFLDDCALGKTIRMKYKLAREIAGMARVKKGQSVGVRSRQRYLYHLKVPAKFFELKSMRQLKAADVESFVRALETNQLSRRDGDPYAGKSKSNIKKTLILFLRWLYGEETEKYYEMTYWIDTRYKRKSKPCLDESQIRTLLEKCLTIKEKVLIVSLFDGGMRIEEFLNVRLGDVVCVAGEAPYYRMRVREEFSKTTGREIPLFWSESYAIIRQWLTFEARTDSEAVFFKCSYSAVREMLKRIGGRANIASIHAHLFRHSSATHYANEGWSEYQLNKRFGWSDKSDMGRHYVEQSKIDIENHKRVKEYEEKQLGGLREQLEKQREENLLLRGIQESLKADQAKFKSDALMLEKELKAFRKLTEEYRTLQDKNRIHAS